MDAWQIIETLKMKPHPEGGYYAETFRHPNIIGLPDGRMRNLSTTIYFLLTGKDKSHFHRLASEETWFFHTGETIEIITLENGITQSCFLGDNLLAGHNLQLLIPANTWFAAHLPSKEGFALVSCTVCPGFDFSDFELATENQLLNESVTLSESLKNFLI